MWHKHYLLTVSMLKLAFSSKHCCGLIQPHRVANMDANCETVKIVKNPKHSIPTPKETSSNVFFCLTKVQRYSVYNDIKQKIAGNLHIWEDGIRECSIFWNNKRLSNLPNSCCLIFIQSFDLIELMSAPVRCTMVLFWEGTQAEA